MIWCLATLPLACFLFSIHQKTYTLLFYLAQTVGTVWTMNHRSHEFVNVIGVNFELTEPGHPLRCGYNLKIFSWNLESPTPSWMTVENASHYLQYSSSIYGWATFLHENRCSSWRLLQRLQCCGRLRRDEVCLDNILVITRFFMVGLLTTF